MSSLEFQRRLFPKMGCFCAACPSGKSPEEVELASRSKEIDRQIKSDQRKMQQEVKLLLLGAGESGKSTFLKQMKIIHGVVFEPEQLKEFRKIIYQNMIKAMRVLVDAQRKLGITLQDSSNRLAGDQVIWSSHKSRFFNRSTFTQYAKYRGIDPERDYERTWKFSHTHKWL